VRKAINDNPAVQIGVLAVLALLVGFLLLTRMSHKSSESSTESSASATSSASTVTPSATSTESSSVAPSTTAPDATAVAPTPTSPSTGAAGPAASAPGKFVAGPGLPAAVVDAYNANRVVVLLVVRRNGIDDDAVRKSVENMAGSGNIALFVTHAGHIARYSRIATGVNVDRVPALIVLRPRNLTHGVPTAMVSYGFRSPESVAQAIHDATYKGPTNEPYYPK
jgi:hypothetical protein